MMKETNVCSDNAKELSGTHLKERVWGGNEVGGIRLENLSQSVEDLMDIPLFLENGWICYACALCQLIL